MFHAIPLSDRLIKRQATEHFLNLVNMAASDGEIHPREFEILVEIGIESGFSESQMKYVIQHPSEHEFVMPNSRLQANKLLSDLVKMALADGNIAESEYERLCGHSDRLQVPRQDLDYMIMGFKIAKDTANTIKANGTYT